MVGNNGCKQAFEYVPRQKRERLPNGQISVGGLPSFTFVTTDIDTTNYISKFKEYSMSGTTATLVRTDAIEYDANGNITKYGDVTYEYDKLGRLVRENNPTTGIDKTVTWCYDISGNILSRTEYAYTAGDLAGVTPINTFTYTYDTNWKDQLVEVKKNGVTQDTFDYDSAGNPTRYKGASLTWFEGRNLHWYRAEGSDMVLDMEYSADGTRVRKIREFDDESASEIVTYVYNGSNLVYEKEELSNRTRRKYFLYNNQGIVGFVYNTITYMFRKNLFGDITAIYRGNTKVAEYRYDAWGNCVVVDPATGLANTSIEFIGNQNPFRYRGYYWDNDLGLYYLMSRYYDPQVGRFINADSLEYLDPETIGGLNLYAYCGNNPVMYADPSGHVAILTLLIGAFIGAAVSFVSSVISQSTTDDKEINWGQVALDTIIGGISGALGASGVTRIVSIVAGGILGVVGSVGGDLIASNGDWSKVNIGKAVLMGTIGAVAGRFTGAGAQNTKAMNQAINSGKSWGSKAFLKSAQEAAIRPNSGLVLQTMYMNMAKAISKYTVQAVFNVSLATFGTTFLGNAISW